MVSCSGSFGWSKVRPPAPLSMAESDRISPPPRRFVKRTTRVLARSGTFVRIRAGIGYITHTRVMHQVMYEVSTHRPRPTRLVNSSDSQPVPRRREGGSTRLSPRAIGAIRTLPGWGGGVHTAAGHLRTTTDQASHSTVKSTGSANDPPRSSTHHSHL